MNKVILLGRLTKDPEVKTTGSGVSACSFTVACDRKFKSQNGERQTDFISCVAWRQQADILGKYFHKGNRIALEGTIQTRSYEKNGQTQHVTEVMVENLEFVESKNQNEQAPAQAPAQKTPAPAQAQVAQAPMQAAPMQAAPMQAAPLPAPDMEVLDAEEGQLPFDIMGY